MAGKERRWGVRRDGSGARRDSRGGAHKYAPNQWGPPEQIYSTAAGHARSVIWVTWATPGRNSSELGQFLLHSPHSLLPCVHLPSCPLPTLPDPVSAHPGPHYVSHATAHPSLAHFVRASWGRHSRPVASPSMRSGNTCSIVRARRSVRHNVGYTRYTKCPGLGCPPSSWCCMFVHRTHSGSAKWLGGWTTLGHDLDISGSARSIGSVSIFS